MEETRYITKEEAVFAGNQHFGEERKHHTCEGSFFLVCYHVLDKNFSWQKFGHIANPVRPVEAGAKRPRLQAEKVLPAKATVVAKPKRPSLDDKPKGDGPKVGSKMRLVFDLCRAAEGATKDDLDQATGNRVGWRTRVMDLGVKYGFEFSEAGTKKNPRYWLK